MIYIGKYQPKDKSDYYSYIKSKVPEDLQKKVVRLLNSDLDTNSVTEVSDFEELITMDFKRLKSIYSNLKSTSKLRKLKMDLNYFSEIMEDETKRIDEKNQRKYIKNIYKNIILRLKKDLAFLKESETLEEFKNKYSYFTKDRSGGKKNNIELSKALKLTVCPYCNRNFINNRGERESGRQFDHFFSKDETPYFALSLYNLVPSCFTCNHTKSTDDMECCPFDLENYKDRKLKFKVEFPSGNITVEETVPDVRILKLNEAYEIHTVEVKHLFRKEEEYCQSYRKQLLNKVASEHRYLLSEEQFDRMIYGDIINLDHTKFRNEVISYLKYDTYQTIRYCRGLRKE